jgi:hypothetical protein
MHVWKYNNETPLYNENLLIKKRSKTQKKVKKNIVGILEI